MLKHLFQPLLDWYQHALQSGGFWVVGLLMTMESSVLPLPSESIIPLAASWSHDHKIKLSLTGIVIAGAIGSWLGATLVYWLARLAGRPLLVRYGRFVLITPEKIQKAEIWSAHYGSAGVFVARLLPGARQLVGIPAGIAKFDYLKFSIFTLARLGHLVLRALLARRQNRRRYHQGRNASRHTLGGWYRGGFGRTLLFLRPPPGQQKIRSGTLGIDGRNRSPIAFTSRSQK